DEARAEIADRAAGITHEERRRRDRFGIEAERTADVVRELDEDPDRVPDRDTDGDEAEIAQHAVAAEQREEAAARDGRVGGRELRALAGLAAADAQPEQREAEAAADVIGGAPVDAGVDRRHAAPDEARGDTASDAEAGDDRGRDAARALVHQ